MLRLNSSVDKPNRRQLYDALVESMVEGIKIEIPNELAESAEADKQYLTHIIQTKHGVQNPNSSKQVQEKLRELSEVFPEVREFCYNDKNDTWTSSGDALEKLKDCNIDFINTLMLYRKATSITKALKSLTDAQDANGYIHPIISFQVTNRISYSEPGVMSIPKKLLWQVVKPRKTGWSIWRIDIKNQEPWIMINKLKVGRLQELLKLSGSLGLYRMIYNDIYGTLPNTEQYKEIKTAWNALTYGSSKKGMMETTFHMGETDTEPTDHGEAFYKWFTGFDEIKQYQKETRSNAYRGIRKAYTVFGTELEIKGCTPTMASRRLMDYWIQGTGADILTFLVSNLIKYIEDYGLQEHLRLYYTRHDEVIVEVSPECMRSMGENKVESMLNYIFSHTIDDWYPCGLEIERIKNDDTYDMSNIFDEEPTE